MRGPRASAFDEFEDAIGRSRGGGGGGIGRVLLVGAALAAILAASSCSLSGCSQTIESGEVGIKTTKFGTNPGVQPQELPPGWHWEGFGEKIRSYPVRQRTYSYTRETNADGKENEEIAFADANGQPMTADVAMTVQVQQAKAADLFASWRQEFDELLDGQIRNDVRSAIAAESEKVQIQQMISGGRQQVLARALQRVRAKWDPQGVRILQMEWVGPIRYPASVQQAIEARTQAEQATRAAQQRVELANANAAAQVAKARGDAESAALRAQAARNNQELIPLLYAEAFKEKWDGRLPQVQGGGTPLINLPAQQ